MSRPIPRPHLRLVHSSAPVSHRSAGNPWANGFDPRAVRMGFPAVWGRFVRETMPSREVAAAVYGVTFQTACNWWDDLVVPMGDKVAIGALGWPEAYGRIVLGQGCDLRVAS